MTDDLPISNLLRIVAPYAIYKWAESEKITVEKIQPSRDVDKEIFNRWRSQWSLNRIKINSVTEMVGCLNEIRIKLGETKGYDDLAEVVQTHTEQEGGFCNTGRRQASLLSKFAFSLYPDRAVPYDQYALAGLINVSGSKRVDLEHRYPQYLKEFNRFAAKCCNKLDTTGQTELLRPIWSPIMCDNLFKRRTADKLLMFLGMLTKSKTKTAAEIAIFLQAWTVPSLLAGAGFCQWQNPQNVVDHLNGIKLDLDGLRIEVPELGKHLEDIASRFNSG